MLKACRCNYWWEGDCLQFMVTGLSGIFRDNPFDMFDLVVWTHPLVVRGCALHPCPNLCHAGLHRCIAASPLFLISSGLFGFQCTAPQRCRWDGGYSVLGLRFALGFEEPGQQGMLQCAFHMQFKGCQYDLLENDWSLKPLKLVSRLQSFSPSCSPIHTMHYGTREENTHSWLCLKRIWIQVIDIQSK